LVAEGDLVELGDGVGLDRSQSLAEALASLPQELKRVRGRTLGSGAIRISPVLFYEVGLQGRSDLVGCLQRVVDGPVPRGVVNHMASIPSQPLDAGRQGAHSDECSYSAGILADQNFRSRAVAAVERGIVEEGNLQAALDALLSAAHEGDVVASETGMQLCGDLWMYWHIRGKNLTARKYAASFIEAAASAAPSTGRAGALITAGLASWVLGRYEQANQEWDQAYRIAAELEAEREIGISALLWGLGLLGFDLDAALTRASESIERSRSAELTWVEGLASTIDGILHTVARDLDTAGARYRGALAIQERLGDPEGAGLSLVPERVSCPPARIAAVIGLGEPAG